MSNFTPYTSGPSFVSPEYDQAGLAALQLQAYRSWLYQTTIGAVFFWIMLEIAFIVVLNYVLLPNLHRLKTPTPFRGDIIHMMKKTLDQAKVLNSYNFELFARGFCNMAKFEDICIDNYRSFLSWLMYHKHLKDLNTSERDDLDTIVSYTADHHPESLQLKPGLNPEVAHCRMTLEPLPVIHRPLLLYVMANLTEIVANQVLLRGCGFQHLELDGMTYWYKQHDHHDHLHKDDMSSHGDEPLVFLHGISTGWMVYSQLVKALGKNRTMVLVDTDAIKVKSLNFDMPSPEQFVDRMERILNRHNIAKASFVGHSFGSITSGWFVHYHPNRVSHLTLIDPVSLLLGLPNVAYSFLYRKPSTIMEWIIHVTAARELTISYSLRRHFYWYNNNLWLEDIPAHIGIVVGVSSNDEITCAQAVFEYANNCRTARMQTQRAQDPAVSLCHTNTVSSSPHSPREVSAITVGMVTQEIKQGSEQEQERGPRGTTSIPDHHGLPALQTNTSKIAKIECVLWEGYSHGQILLPSQKQADFVELVRNNEKLGSSY